MTGERALVRLGVAVVLLSIVSVALAGAAGDARVTDATVDRPEVAAGESATVAATVENEGDEAATVSVRLLVDGRAVVETAVSLGPGERRDVSLAYVFEKPGEYDVAVNDAPAGTVTVAEPGSETPDPGDDGVPVALVALVAVPLVAVVASVAYLARVRRTR